MIFSGFLSDRINSRLYILYWYFDGVSRTQLLKQDMAWVWLCYFKKPLICVLHTGYSPGGRSDKLGVRTLIEWLNSTWPPLIWICAICQILPWDCGCTPCTPGSTGSVPNLISVVIRKLLKEKHYFFSQNNYKTMCHIVLQFILYLLI